MCAKCLFYVIFVIYLYVNLFSLTSTPPLATSTSVNIIAIYSFENACYLDGFKSIWGMCVYL